MIIPERKDGAAGSHAIYRNWRRAIMNGRDERAQFLERLRLWYLSGTETGDEARYNKLAEFVDTSSAYMFSPDGAMFGTGLPPEHGDTFLEELEVYRDEVQRLWHDRGIGLTLGINVEYGHVYPSTLVKVHVSGRGASQHVAVSSVHPSDLCVLQEDLDSLDANEVVLEFYNVNVSTFRRIIATHQDYAKLMVKADGLARIRGPQTSLLPPAINSMIISSFSPTMTGSAAGGGLAYPQAQAKVDEPTVELCELWVWDDDTNDWHVVTMFDDDVIKEGPNPLILGELPYHQLCLMPTDRYLWGVSTIQGLLQLQEWRERRMGDIDRLLRLQLDSPIAFIGIMGNLDERAKNLREPGGDFSDANPGARVERMAPPMPPDAFAEVKEIDEMFARRGGLPQLLQGQGEAGLRAGNQTGTLATLGSARLRRRAMRVESWVDSVMTQVLRLHKRTAKGWLKKPDGTTFLLDQVPDSIYVRVSAHSASPLYAEQIVQKAVIAMDRRAITKARFVSLLQLPMDEMVQSEARKIAKQEAEVLKIKMQIEKEKADAKLAQAEKTR